MFCYFSCYGFWCQTHQWKEVFFYQQISVRLEVAETNWITEFFVLNSLKIWIMFALYVEVDVLSYTRQLSSNYRSEVEFNSFLEIVKSIDKSSDISFEWPASFSLLDQSNKIVKGISLDEFANIDRVAVIDKRGHDLVETAKIGKFGAHYNLFTVSVIVLVFFNQRSNVILSWYHDILIWVILHYLQNLNLVTSETSAIAVNQISEEI